MIIVRIACNMQVPRRWLHMKWVMLQIDKSTNRESEIQVILNCVQQFLAPSFFFFFLVQNPVYPVSNDFQGADGEFNGGEKAPSQECYVTRTRCRLLSLEMKVCRELADVINRASLDSQDRSCCICWNSLMSFRISVSFPQIRFPYLELMNLKQFRAEKKNATVYVRRE